MHHAGLLFQKLKSCFYHVLVTTESVERGGEGMRGNPYNGLYREAPPKRGTFFRMGVYERAGISQANVWQRVRKTHIQRKKRECFYCRYENRVPCIILCRVPPPPPSPSGQMSPRSGLTYSIFIKYGTGQTSVFYTHQVHVPSNSFHIFIYWYRLVLVLGTIILWAWQCLEGKRRKHHI